MLTATSRKPDGGNVAREIFALSARFRGRIMLGAVADFALLKNAVLEYLSEMDNPAPDLMERVRKRNALRKMVGAPPAPKPRAR